MRKVARNRIALRMFRDHPMVRPACCSVRHACKSRWFWYSHGLAHPVCTWYPCPTPGDGSHSYAITCGEWRPVWCPPAALPAWPPVADSWGYRVHAYFLPQTATPALDLSQDVPKANRRAKGIGWRLGFFCLFHRLLRWPCIRSWYPPAAATALLTVGALRHTAAWSCNGVSDW